MLAGGEGEGEGICMASGTNLHLCRQPVSTVFCVPPLRSDPQGPCPQHGSPFPRPPPPRQTGENPRHFRYPESFRPTRRTSAPPGHIKPPLPPLLFRDDHPIYH